MFVGPNKRVCSPQTTIHRYEETISLPGSQNRPVRLPLSPCRDATLCWPLWCPLWHSVERMSSPGALRRPDTHASGDPPGWPIAERTGQWRWSATYAWRERAGTLVWFDARTTIMVSWDMVQKYNHVIMRHGKEIQSWYHVTWQGTTIMVSWDMVKNYNHGILGHGKELQSWYPGTW